MHGWTFTSAGTLATLKKQPRNKTFIVKKQRSTFPSNMLNKQMTNSTLQFIPAQIFSHKGLQRTENQLCIEKL